MPYRAAPFDTTPAPGHMLRSELKDSDIKKKSTLHLVLRLRGGGKPLKFKEEKGHAAPKNIKRKHKKSFYTVDKDGKLICNNKECPSCGPGVFMARHRDRHSCGKCRHMILISVKDEPVKTEPQDGAHAVKTEPQDGAHAVKAED